MIDEIKSSVENFYDKHEDTIQTVALYAGVGIGYIALLAGAYYTQYKVCEHACTDVLHKNGIIVKK